MAKVKEFLTHYEIQDGKVLEYDLRKNRSGSRFLYSRRQRGKTEGMWFHIYSDQINWDLATAKKKSVKQLRRSIASDKKYLKRDEKRLKDTLKIKVPAKTKKVQETV